MNSIAAIVLSGLLAAEPSPATQAPLSTTGSEPAPTAPVAAQLESITDSLTRSAPSLAPSLRVQAGDRHLEKGDLPAARKEYEAALVGVSLLQDQPPPWKMRAVDQLLDIAFRLEDYRAVVTYWTRFEPMVSRHMADSRRRELQIQVAEAFWNFRHYGKAAELLGAAVSDSVHRPLAPTLKLKALAELAQIAEIQKENDEALKRWTQVEELAEPLLSNKRNVLTDRDRIEATRRLADSFRYRHQPKRSIELLEPLRPLHQRMDDHWGECETLTILADRYAECNEREQAIQCLTTALEIDSKFGSPHLLQRPNMQLRLGEYYSETRRHDEAAAVWKEAAETYRAVLDRSRSDRTIVVDAIEAMWKLQLLYQRSSQYRQALDLVREEMDVWSEESWLATRLETEEANLSVVLGSHQEARDVLQATATRLRAQDPIDLTVLPRTLNSLAIVEQSLGRIDEADKLGKECLELYRKYELPSDPFLAEVYNLLGTGALLSSQSARAKDLFTEGLSLCDKIGESADRQKSCLHLNLAWLCKSQGDIDPAVEHCEKALRLFGRFSDPDSLGLAWIYATLASMEADRGKYRQAEHWSSRTLALCERHEVKGGMLVTIAQHSLALSKLANGQLDDAQGIWEKMLVTAQEEHRDPVAARSWNYLGAIAERRGDVATAMARYRAAAELQKGSGKALPAVHFISLWRLANLEKKAGNTDRAIDLLRQAIDVAESARVRTYGAESSRARYFSQFSPAFDQIVAWCIEAGRPEDAFRYAERGRSRTFLDQLRLAGMDPRSGLTGAKGDELVRREQELRATINRTRSQAQMIPLQASGSQEAIALLEELHAIQAEYAQVWDEILHSSPVYREILNSTSGDPLQQLRSAVLQNSDGIALFYYLGRRESYVFVIGGQEGDAKAIPLTVSPEVLAKVAMAPELEKQSRGEVTRGIMRSSRDVAKIDEVTNGAKAAQQSIPLTAGLTRALVQVYRRRLELPSGVSRGIIRAGATEDETGVNTTNEWLSHVLMPRAVLAEIRSRSPQVITLIPDGALHKLPFEALVLREKPSPVYVLDELPPIAYAPSATVMTLLAQRGRATIPAGEAPSLLTVANPSYPQVQPRRSQAIAVAVAAKSTESSTATRDASAYDTILGFRGQLPPLPFTSEECRRIRALFPDRQIEHLEGESAAEAEVVAHIAGKQYVHLAAHGFVDESFGNLFGAIALTPNASRTASGEEDGFLSLYEIQQLPLKDCEVAVLSACVTNVGWQHPLEAGVTLASAFLTAGSRRVVASHWSVDDQSTAELMATFFAELNRDRSERSQDWVGYARALQAARRKVRTNKHWNDPFFWAPFVLLGPADDRYDP